MGISMELLILVVGLVALAFFAARYGHDSRPGFDTPRDTIDRDGLLMPDTSPEAPGAPVVAPHPQSWLHLPRMAQAWRGPPPPVRSSTKS
jgi:hypothetical protein